MNIETNLKLLEIERQQWVDREKKRLEDVKPIDGVGWLFAKERLEVAELKLRQAKERRSYGPSYRDPSKE